MTILTTNTNCSCAKSNCKYFFADTLKAVDCVALRERPSLRSAKKDLPIALKEAKAGCDISCSRQFSIGPGREHGPSVSEGFACERSTGLEKKVA